MEIGSESGKEAGIPGLLGPVPVLHVGPTRGVASRRAAVRVSPDSSAGDPRPAAPGTRKAAGITGGGGRADPGSLGVFRRPGEREAAVCAAAPALALSLLSIPHLMRRQTCQHPRSSTVPTLQGPGSWHLAAPSPASPPMGVQTSASIHFPPTQPHSPAQPLTAVPKSHPHHPSTDPACPNPPPLSCLCSLSAPEIHDPTPRPVRTQTTSLGDRRLPQAPDGVGELQRTPGSPRQPRGTPAPARRRSGPGCRRAVSGRQRTALGAHPPRAAESQSAIHSTC